MKKLIIIGLLLTGEMIEGRGKWEPTTPNFKKTALKSFRESIRRSTTSKAAKLKLPETTTSRIFNKKSSAALKNAQDRLQRAPSFNE